MTRTIDVAELARARAWDPIVRVTHWGVALAIVVNEYITRGGSLFHIWAGYVALALLALRLVWGLVGTDEARFSAFPPTVTGSRQHLRDLLAGRAREYPSHNPLGTLMVYSLWATLAVVIATGVAMEPTLFPPAPATIVSPATASVALHGSVPAPVSARPGEAPGPVAQQGEAGVGGSGERFGGAEHFRTNAYRGTVAYAVHWIAADVLLLLALLHLGGVVVESILSGKNLAREMLTGVRMPPR